MKHSNLVKAAVTLLMGLTYGTISQARRHHGHYRRHSYKIKHVIKVNMAGEVTSRDVEPLSLAQRQKVAELIVQNQKTLTHIAATKALHRGHSRIRVSGEDAREAAIDNNGLNSNFGTADDNRVPASIDSGKNALKSAKLNVHDLQKMLQSMRKKVDRSIHEEYD